MSDIPAARDELEQLAEDFPALAHRIEPIVAKMHRRPPAKRRAPTECKPVGKATAAQIRAYCARKPSHSVRKVAQIFGVNQGRVSEAIHHDR